MVGEAVDRTLTTCLKINRGTGTPLAAYLPRQDAQEAWFLPELRLIAERGHMTGEWPLPRISPEQNKKGTYPPHLNLQLIAELDRPPPRIFTKQK